MFNANVMQADLERLSAAYGSLSVQLLKGNLFHGNWNIHERHIERTTQSMSNLESLQQFVFCKITLFNSLLFLFLS
jgi:hypothetical protein